MIADPDAAPDARGVVVCVVGVLTLSFLQGVGLLVADGTLGSVLRTVLGVFGGGLGAGLLVVVLVVVAAGRCALPGFLRPTVRTGVGWRLWAVAICGPLTIGVAALLLTGTDRDASPALGLGVLLGQILVVGPIFAYAENLAWRRWLQEGFRRWVGPLAAGALVGVVWALWHLPLFLFDLTEVHAGLPWGAYSAGVVGFSVLLAVVYERADRSLLHVVASHVVFNVVVGTSVLRSADPASFLLLVGGLSLVAGGAVNRSNSRSEVPQRR